MYNIGDRVAFYDHVFDDDNIYPGATGTVQFVEELEYQDEVCQNVWVEWDDQQIDGLYEPYRGRYSGLNVWCVLSTSLERAKDEVKIEEDYTDMQRRVVMKIRQLNIKFKMRNKARREEEGSPFDEEDDYDNADDYFEEEHRA